MSVQLSRRPFTVEEYHQMALAGILDEDDRVELLRGEIVEMSPIGSRHAACVDRLTRLLVVHVGGNAIVRVQNPIRLDDYSEPEPDLALLHWRDDYYAEALPGAADVGLVVEVAESSIRFDQDEKVPLYARAGIQEVWIVDLGAAAVAVYREPQGQGYGVVQRLGRGEVLSPVEYPKIELAVAEVLG